MISASKERILQAWVAQACNANSWWTTLLDAHALGTSGARQTAVAGDR